ncbi:hypothetical protein BH09BAC5_BH09BAC5_10330 [soil metagenome]
MKLKSYTALICIALLPFFSTLKAQAPQLDWAIGVGGTGSDYGNAIALDAQGNTYTTGFFSGTVDFDPGIGIQNLTSHAYCDIFILKTDASGNFLWAKAIGGGGIDEGNGIAVAPSGNIYITGSFAHTVDFNPSPAPADTFFLTNADDPCNTEIYILKLDNNGNFIWAKSVAGVMTICTAATDEAFALDIDQAENVYVTGYWTGLADFNTSTAPADTFKLQTCGATISGDIFILKLDSAGNFRWVKQIGNALSDTGYGIHVSANGFVYVTGLYGADTDFDPNAGTDIILGYGNWDSFIMKLDTAGNYYWARGFGGTGDDRGMAVTTDANENVIATGHFIGTVDFDPSASNANLTTISYTYGIYLLKLDPNGNYIWAKSINGNGGGERDGKSIALDAASNIYITGLFAGTIDFNPSLAPADTFNITTTGTWSNTDAFILKTDSIGNFIWATSIGAAGVDRGKGIAVDASNHVYSIGFYQGSVDFDPTAGIQNQPGMGSDDIYIQKLNQNPTGFLEMNSNTTSLSVYPNPTNGNFILQANQMNETFALVSITDLSGRILYQKNIECLNREIYSRIDISGFSSGIYFVQVKSGNTVYSAKVVRQ